MSKNISSFFSMHGIISADDREVYEYSFEVLFSYLFSFFATVIIALLSGTVFYTALYFVGFIPLRLVAGGFHAKNHLRCFIILMLVYLTFLLTLLLLSDIVMRVSIIASIIFSILLVFMMAPSEDTNKPISDNDSVRLRRSSRTTVVGFSALIGLLVTFVPDIRIAFSVAMGTLTVGASLLSNYVKHKGKMIIIEEEVILNEED